MGRIKGSRTGCNDRFGGICSVAGCGKVLRAKGLCPGHLYRFNKYGTTDLPRVITFRGECSDCGAAVVSYGSRPRLRCSECLSRDNVRRFYRWLGTPAGRAKAMQNRKQAKAKRNAILAGARGSHTTAEFLALCERTGWRCVYCDRPLDAVTATRDHVIPLSRGGSNAIENIAPACDPCNKSKHARTPEEWATARQLTA